ncbi:phage terminase large subunit [Lactococcus cremoris]|uniref:phage terminase large subunit n=1 Tax=Lactococcus lactis subsp. cremoris TaxID=1359 RepID=UPI002181FB4D|nr:phage terminase large subunit [Lactococcus cremoris]MCT0502073.1 terminase [Lactococcus cremoris]
MNSIAMEAKLELSRRYFWDFAQLTMPNFYKPDRAYLKTFCNELQNFMTDDEHEVLVLNTAPRHGKSLTLNKFEQWLFGQNPKLKIMTGSYNETLSTVFSKGVRDTIQEIKADDTRIVYNDIFPKTKIQYGDSAMNLWSLAGNGYKNYLATSPGGTATGFGADLIVIDDVIKNADEANNAAVLEKHWEWFVNTMLSRLESGGKIIIVMTRWHSRDLAGRALEELPESGYRVKKVSFPVYNEESGKMLCDEILSKVEYDRKRKTMGADIASANYQQIPIDIKGKLYQKFQTYDGSPPDFVKIWNVTDTADKGKDYLCSIVFGETRDKQAYVLDVLYTKEPMEITEKAQANQMIRNRVNRARFEMNNGGRGHMRAVERITRALGYAGCVFEDFAQTANKEARILSNSSWVENFIYFPSDWRTRWPEYFNAMNTFQREGKNKNDDAPDATTLIAETLVTKPKINILKGLI